MEGRRRVTLYDQMASAVDSRRDSLARSTLDALMASQKSAAEPSRHELSSSRTLLDIIREDDSNKKDRGSWKLFRDKLRLMRAGSAWLSAIQIAASDSAIPNRNNNTTTTSNSRLNSDALSTSSRPESPGQISAGRGSPARSRPASFRRDGGVTFRDYLDSDDDGSDSDDWDAAREGTRRLSTILSEERALSAREAASAAGVAVEPARMSLMDLLEENDGQMGFEETGYRVGCGNAKEDEEEEEEDEVVEEGCSNSIQEKCCVCMVRRKGAAFIPCGHTFCRHCSRELWVSRGHCPLCNNLIVEVLDLF